MTQTQLAAVSGIAQANISAIEADRRQPSAATLHQLLTACGYQLVADGGATTIRVPVVPEDQEGDVPRGDVLPARTEAERNRQLVGALELAEALVYAQRDR